MDDLAMDSFLNHRQQDPLLRLSHDSLVNPTPDNDASNMDGGVLPTPASVFVMTQSEFDQCFRLTNGKIRIDFAVTRCISFCKQRAIQLRRGGHQSADWLSAMIRHLNLFELSHQKSIMMATTDDCVSFFTEDILRNEAVPQLLKALEESLKEFTADPIYA